MVSDWLHSAADFATTWLPLAFFLLLLVLAWILWKTVAMMPRTKPANISHGASASSFVEMFAGLGAARIRRLFMDARKNAPAIIFIDELDAVGAQRSGHGFNREQDQTLNQLLVELDGFEGSEQVVVMGASNRI